MAGQTNSTELPALQVRLGPIYVRLRHPAVLDAALILLEVGDVTSEPGRPGGPQIAPWTGHGSQWSVCAVVPTCRLADPLKGRAQPLLGGHRRLDKQQRKAARVACRPVLQEASPMVGRRVPVSPCHHPRTSFGRTTSFACRRIRLGSYARVRCRMTPVVTPSWLW